MLTRLCRTLDIRSLVIAMTLALGLNAISSQAQIFSVDTFRNAVTTQTGDGNTLSLDGYSFTAELRSINANDFTSAQLSYPGPGSPVALATVDPHLFSYQSGLLANKATLDSAFPTGTYQFTATHGATPTVTSLSYTSDDYPAAAPFLTGTNFTALQGLNPASPFTFDFSPFASDPLASAQRIDLRIFTGGLTSLVYDTGLLDFTTTDFTLPANTLLTGQTYAYELNYTNYIGENTPNTQFAGTVNFNNVTFGTFTTVTTAVPEPGAVAIFITFTLSTARLFRKRRRSY